MDDGPVSDQKSVWLVGKPQAAEISELIEKHFGSLPIRHIKSLKEAVEIPLTEKERRAISGFMVYFGAEDAENPKPLTAFIRQLIPSCSATFVLILEDEAFSSHAWKIKSISMGRIHFIGPKLLREMNEVSHPRTQMLQILER